MTTIDHQQAAVRAGAEAIMRAGGLERFLGTSGLYNLPVWLRAKRDSENALTAATPHLRAAWEQPIRELCEAAIKRANDPLAPRVFNGAPFPATVCAQDILALLEGCAE